jgi:hypothetical protein
MVFSKLFFKQCKPETLYFENQIAPTQIVLKKNGDIEVTNPYPLNEETISYMQELDTITCVSQELQREPSDFDSSRDSSSVLSEYDIPEEEFLSDSEKGEMVPWKIDLSLTPEDEIKREILKKPLPPIPAKKVFPVPNKALPPLPKFNTPYDNNNSFILRVNDAFAEEYSREASERINSLVEEIKSKNNSLPSLNNHDYSEILEKSFCIHEGINQIEKVNLERFKKITKRIDSFMNSHFQRGNYADCGVFGFIDLDLPREDEVF